MEQWEAIIERPVEQGHRTFEKILQTATVVLNNAATHLAQFEIEWVMETLLFAPVNLVSTVSERRGDEAWRKAAVDALKLLGLAVAAGAADQHCQHIADLCMLNYDAELRKHALHCLAEVARRSDAAAGHAGRLVAALEEAGQCRAPLALLVGALCEHHPAAVCDEPARIWRGYLNMLDNKKNTDTVIKAALEGVRGLLRHFGDLLPTAELAQLHDDIAHVYIHKPACQTACFAILREHASLFRERVSAEPALRTLLWGSAPADTVLQVYAVTAQCVDRARLEKILATEVLPHTQSPASQNKLTALRVLAASKTSSFGDLTQFVDVHTLEYELRRERVSRADADLVLWCVEYNLPNSERLLQASIIFYENLPSSVRKQILVKGILNSPPEVKRAAIQFLISRCCEDTEALVWRELNDDDAAMRVVARELAECLGTALEAVLDDEELPPKVSALLRLASKTSLTASAPLGACAPLFLALKARGPAVLAAARTILAEACSEETTSFYQSILINECRDEATLQEACLALVQAPDAVDVEPNDMLCALQIIFSIDVEPTIRIAALTKFDNLLSNNKCLDVDICDTIRAVEKLRTRGDRTDKHIRLLHREITMFLGKHGNVDINNNTDSLDDVVVDLKKSLALSLPYQGTSCKVDLKTMLLLALQHEHPNTLLTMLTMLCANLSSNNEVSTQRAVVRVVRALAGAHAAGRGRYTAHVQHALHMCSDPVCGTDMLQYIGCTRSCGVRKLLSAALAALCEDAAILQLTAERTNVMLSSCDSTTKRGGLDIAETIITSLENNNSLSKLLLPELIVLIAKTYESDTKNMFDVASKTFMDKKELFDMETIRKTIHDLLENVLKTNISDVNIYKTAVKMTIQFIKDLRNIHLDKILDTIFDIKSEVDVKLLYVLAVLKSEFGFDIAMSRKILSRENSLLNFLINLKIDKNQMESFKVEAILSFVEEYCEVVLELKYKETLQLLSDLITKLTPALVKKLHKCINTCFSTLHKHLKGTPKQIISSFQTWVEMLPIKKVTDAIERDCFLTEHKLCVGALKIMSNIFEVGEIILSDVKMHIQKWPTILLVLHSSGRLEQYFYNDMPYFTDILMVSLKFATPDDVKKILKSSGFNKKYIGVLFCGFFVHGFFEVLTEIPFILLDEDLKECSVVLNDIVRVVVKKPLLKDRGGNVLELVDKLWPTYEQHASFSQKHSLLVNLECLPGLGLDSNPLQWVIQSVCSRDLSLDDRARLLCLVPEESLKSPEVMTAVSGLFPARLRELRPAVLDAVATRPALLRVVAALSDDSSSGWWDAALESCLASVAKRGKLDTYTDLFSKCHSARVCERILVPLLRHSSAEVCEKFLATVLTKILASLNKRPKGDSAHAGYEKRWDGYMISLHLLLVAFEKLPTSSLESPSSVLYSEITASPWHLVREAGRLVDSLRETRCPSDAPDRLRAMYRKLQCMLYNCLSGGICRRRPGAPLYAQLLSADALSRIVDEHAQCELPIRAVWTQRNRSLPVAVPLESSPLSLSHTQRSRIFLRTLSEDPMLFDLHSTQEDEVMEVQDISLRETPLNAHPCAATLTALLRHVCGVPALAPLWPPLAQALRGGPAPRSWLLAQIICNCKEELKPLASVLLPGLLAVLAGTIDGNSKCMNGLHIDVLDTILYWKEETTSSELNTIAHHLITTCMELRRRNVFDGLLKTLNGFLELYGSSVQIEWKSFEPYYEDELHDTQKAILQLIKVISKNKIYVPQTLSKLLSKLDVEPSKVSECFGLALAACQDAERGAVGGFRKFLEKSGVTTYVRALYYACLGCADCCGEQEFRKITDYVTKVTSHDRTKCLHILSVYLSRGCRSEYIPDMFELVDLSDMIAKDHTALLLVKTGLPVMDEALRRRCVAQVAALRPAAAKVRRLVVEVMLRACEELFAQPTQPPAKRQKTEATTILSVSRDDVYSNTILTCLGVGAVDADPDVAKVARDALGARLDKDLGIRFAECFLLTFYLPAHTDKALSVSVCVSALLAMLYSDVRAAESFRNSRLREEPLHEREAGETSRLLTLSRTFQGTFRSYGGTRGRTQPRDTNEPAINVQMPIDGILEALLEFAKTTPEAGRALLTEALRSVLSTGKFDLASALGPQLGTLLGHAPSELTPVYIDVCRVLMPGSEHGLLGPVERLRALTAGTEGASLARLLYEEVSMRYMGDRMFQLGQPSDASDVAMDDTTTFSIEDLKCAFGKLANWDDLTLQQRKSVKNSSLPPLWTDRGDFVSRLDSYEVPADTQCWFDKMAAAFKQEMGPNSIRWLRKMEHWPRRHFEISAITEASSWRHEASETMPTRLFAAGDCLAEWAARLMIRSSYYTSLQHSETDGNKVNKLSRLHELKWCVRANEMGIPRAALQCVDRNVGELCESETLPWLRQKLLALRQLALERDDTNLLRDALEKAKKYTPSHSSNASVTIEMYHLMLVLHKDLKSLTYHELQTILVQVNQSAQQVDWSISSKKAVSSVYEIAMAHYDESVETGAMDIDSALAGMCHVFCAAAALATPAAPLLAVLLARLDDSEGQLGDQISHQLLEELSPLAPSLDTFTLELLGKNCHKFATHLQKSFSAILPKNPSAEKYRRCLQLVCDPNHLLTHYCEELALALRSQDATRWKRTLDRMKDKIYENPYAGPSYKLLDKYKGDLYGMYEFDPSPDFASRAEAKLKSIIMAVTKAPQTTLRLADLCPALLDHREGSGAAKWFGLNHARVVKFYDKVQVFTDSIRRPVVISMLVSNGRTHRAIQKTGERLAGDAAAQHVAARMSRLCGARTGGYTVTLLDEESALIEYLEGHERLRTLIASTCNLDVLQSVSRPADQSLAESPAAALRAHADLCSQVPAQGLRSAVEQISSCVQDFISKKQNFTDSLADMTLLTWLLGLGDRHLHNVLCSRAGVVRSVDWGDVWARAADPPARLTRNLLALADPRVLEARLQGALGALRDSAPLVEATVRVSFHWMPSLQEQLQHVRGILRGVTSSYGVARDVTSRSRLRHKDKYLELLDRVLADYRGRARYSVEDQVSCLLRHCTAPELLSVARSGWEPWV